MLIIGPPRESERRKDEPQDENSRLRAYQQKNGQYAVHGADAAIEDRLSSDCPGQQHGNSNGDCGDPQGALNASNQGGQTPSGSGFLDPR